jgi:hypothetical protein
MNEDLIADLWAVFVEHIPEKQKKDTAYEFINILLDYGVKESVIEGLMGIDPWLDGAVEYAIDDEDGHSDDFDADDDDWD